MLYGQKAKADCEALKLPEQLGLCGAVGGGWEVVVRCALRIMSRHESRIRGCDETKYYLSQLLMDMGRRRRCVNQVWVGVN